VEHGPPGAWRGLHPSLISQELKQLS
jgi:hypothetical protein